MNEKTKEVFFTLLRTGLWEGDVCLSQYSQFSNIDYDEIYQKAQEQSVVGLLVAGIEHVKDVKALQEFVHQMVGQILGQRIRSSSERQRARE